MLEKFFKLKENGTDAKTEILAGITTFMTMAYILAVNPSILAAAGMDCLLYTSSGKCSGSHGRQQQEGDSERFPPPLYFL